MDVSWRRREKGPLLAAILALAVLGAGSLFLTWQSIERQREALDEHMALAGGAVMHGVEGQIMRLMRDLRSGPGAASLMPLLASELFKDMAGLEDISFIGLYGRGGLLAAASGEPPPELGQRLPDQVLAALAQNGRWSRMAGSGEDQVLLLARPARPPLARACDLARPGPGRPAQGPPAVLTVGLNAKRHLARFDQSRRAAMIQAGYVLGAALLLWGLGFAYLRRRDQARRLSGLERFQSKLLDSMPDGILSIGPAGEITAANGSAAGLLAAPGERTRLIGRKWSEFPFQDLCQGPEWRKYDHQGRRLEMLCVPLQEPAGPQEAPERLILVRDRTRMKALEDDLQEARRLAEVGSLAAGVAHEVRNPLSSLRGFAQLFAEKLAGDQTLAAYAETMVQEADRLNRVVTDLLFLARPRDLAPRDLDLDAAVQDLFRLLRFELKAKEVSPRLDIEAETVFADPDALRQALLNLLVNSLDALPDKGGELRLASRRGADAKGWPGTWLSVEDNGPGMAGEVRDRALEPFYTAKEKGTGLGLAIVQTIMRGHKGLVEIDSGPGQGARLKLFFPDPEAGDERPAA